jgi:hypothetical protein
MRGYKYGCTDSVQARLVKLTVEGEMSMRAAALHAGFASVVAARLVKFMWEGE